MCGIAGVIDLRGQREIEPHVVMRMAAAITHRGPDEDGFLFERGIGLANRRLSIVGLHDGRQPIFNEDKSVVVVFNGELFDYPEKKADLESRGHVFRTSCDTELLVHLWEEYGEGMLTHLRGQYGFALYDFDKRTLIFARDRVGICPLHWARRGDYFYFGSEIKAILASGKVRPEADPAGIDSIMTFFGMPSRRTAFEGISSILPGHFLKIQFRNPGELADITEGQYWDLDFPDAGSEYDPANPQQLVDEFRSVFERAVEIRLRADVPVVGYLSGGIDSAAVVATASKIRGAAVPSFTIKIDSPKFDETDQAMMAARTIGCRPTIVKCDAQMIAGAYPELVRAADSPVVDTACAALYRLAGEVHRQGYKVALTGEGSDEALAGYPWFKINRLMRLADMGRFRPSNLIRRAVLGMANPNVSWNVLPRIHAAVGGPHAQADLYSLIGLSRQRFYRQDMFERLDGHIAFDDLVLNKERMQHWAPLNQSLYLGYKTILPGLLINQKGDRPAMANSVETRYPFLDEEFVAFAAKIHPRWKLRGLLRDKHILREFAKGLLPAEIANRPKAMFRAPFAESFFDNPPAYVNQLLSRESLQKSSFFDVDQVEYFRANYKRFWAPGKRLVLEMGLTAVMATQLWRHLYLGGGLCELPTWSAPEIAPTAEPFVAENRIASLAQPQRMGA